MSDASAISFPNPSTAAAAQPPPCAPSSEEIVVCPVCETRYRVAAAALGGSEGREVRCASCGNAWHYSAEGAAIQAGLANAAANAKAPVAFPAPSVDGARPPPLRETEPRLAGPAALLRAAIETRPPPRRRRFGFGWLGLAAVVAAVILIGAIGREAVIRNWFGAGRLYAQLRPVEAPGDGLKVSVTPTRTADSLVVKGSIVNSAASARAIPRLRISLRDEHKILLASTVITPPVRKLPPGKSAHFEATFKHPSDAATGVEVTFEKK